MMNKESKKNYIEKMKKVFSSSEAVMIAQYQGLNVKELDSLRKELREKGICLKSFLNKSMEHSLHHLKEGFTLLIGILMLVTIPIISTFLLFVALILGTGCRLWDGIRHTE